MIIRELHLTELITIKNKQMKTTKYISIALIGLTFVACTKTEFDDFESLNSGTANFSNYIAVGNSLTQGFQDNGLHNEFNQQNNSYPAILAKQMNTNFLQPTVLGADGSGYLKLTSLAPDIDNVPAASGWNNWDNNKKYNNLGISGIRLTDCVPTNGSTFSPTINQVITSQNPYGKFLDFGSLFSPVTYLEHVKNSNATFYTCWLGNNDVLGWATSGGDDGEINISGIPIPIKTSELTPVAVFRAKYDSIMGAFEKMGAKGVCATIPDVTSIPFFNTVTLAAIGAEVWITEGPYSNNPGNVRKATPDDLILLSTKDKFSTTTGHGFVQANPLTHEEVLDKDEVAVVRNHTVLLNNEIKASANAHGAAIADMHEYMFSLKSGMTFDGVAFDAKFIEGGAFSLDGVHPNTRGYALVANKFIEVINQAYGSNLRPVMVHDYRGIIFP